MYLFRGDFGCMLFTGDFRWETSGKGAENGRAVLLDALKNQTLDNLYLDNTYCNPNFSFPSREVAAKQVVDIITSHPDHDIVIGIDSLGKEDLLLYISQALSIKIWVWPERLQIMHLLGFHQNFTTQTSLTRVRAIPRYSFCTETLEALNTLRPTLGIMASGLPWFMEAAKKDGSIFGCSATHVKKKECGRNTGSCSKIHGLGGNSGNAARYHDYIFVVPYSDHSCYSEIQEFIELLRPVNIRGIVSSKSCHIDPRYYFDHLCGAEQALWRVQQKLENEEGVDRVKVADIKHIAEGISPVTGRKRKIDQIDFFGIRVSRVSLLRRLNRGVKLADTECLFE